MNTLLTLALIYWVGVFIAAWLIRRENSTIKTKYKCISPSTCLLSWIFVVLNIFARLLESSEEGSIAKLFKYTDKK